MAQRKITYNDKTNKIPPVEPDRQVSASDMNELKTIINSNADDAVSKGAVNETINGIKTFSQRPAVSGINIGGLNLVRSSVFPEHLEYDGELILQEGDVVSGSANDKNWFETPLALRTAYPEGEAGWFATVGSTTTLWMWSVTLDDWANTGVIAASGSSVTTEEITSIGVGDIGGINAGRVIPIGTDINAFIKSLIQKVIPPTYSPPVVTLAITPTGTQEIGFTGNFLLTPSFTQNDGGIVTNVVFTHNGLTIRSQSNLTPYTDNRLISGTNSYTVVVSYAQGTIKNDNFGTPSPDGRIASGLVIGSASIVGQYRNWFGAYGVNPPSSGANIRTMGYSYLNSFTLNTGTTSLNQVIAIPSTKSLQSVIDADALGVDITSSYVLSGTILTVPNGGGVNVNYKVYIQTNSVPYSSNHKHNVIIS